MSNIPKEAILEVWNVRATSTRGIGHYVILLNEGTHLCTCLLLINKGLVCRHFFRVGTYSRFATFHISIIPNRWYLNPNVTPNVLFQRYSFIPVCDKTQLEDIPFKNQVTFQHFCSIRIDSYGFQSSHSQSFVRSPKVIYAELSGLSKKAIDCAIRSDMQDELINIFKAFIYDMQSVLAENSTEIGNPLVIKHKGRPPKRLVANVEKDLHREKKVLEDSRLSSTVNTIEGQSRNNLENSTIIVKGRKCGKCNQYGHYAKTCLNA